MFNWFSYNLYLWKNWYELWTSRWKKFHKTIIAIEYDELINFPDIDESDGKEESSGFNIVSPDLIDFSVASNGDSSHISFSHSWESIVTTRTVLLYVVSTEWCSKAFLVCAFNWMMLKSISLVSSWHTMKCKTASKNKEENSQNLSMYI